MEIIKRFSFILFILILSGCSVVNQDPNHIVVSPRITPSKINDLPHPSETQSLRSTDEPLKPSPTIQPTSIPTLTGIDSTDIYEELVKNNNGCEYPCWGGIVPGKTKWSNVENLFSSFAHEIKSYYYLASIEESSIVYVLEAPAPEYLEPDGIMEVRFDVDQEGVVRFISDETSYAVVGKNLSYFFNTFGIPDMIMVWATGETINGYGEGYSLLLFYPSQGIMSIFNADVKMEEKIDLCPSDFLEYSGIWLWDPEERLGFEDFWRIVLSAVDIHKYKNIEEISDIDTESFFDLYKEQENLSECIDIDIATNWQN